MPDLATDGNRSEFADNIDGHTLVDMMQRDNSKRTDDVMMETNCSGNVSPSKVAMEMPEK